MQALVWWFIPVVAFVVAVVWVSVSNRPRPPADTHDSVAEHERFRQAMNRQTARPVARPQALADDGLDGPADDAPGPQ